MPAPGVPTRRHRPAARLSRALAAQGTLARTALARPSLRLLLLAYFAYTLARKASRLVLLVYAFELGGVRATALVAVAMLLPAALAAPFTAALGDRMSPHRALALGYAAQGVALAATGAAVLMGGSLVLVATGGAIANVAFAVTRPIHQATLPDVAEHPDELALGNAASVWVDGLASLLGPLLAGLVLVLAGPAVELVMLAAVCGVAAVLSLRITLRRIVRAPEAERLRDVLLEGLRTLAADPDGARLSALLALQYAVVGLLDVLLVVFVAEVLGLEAATVSLLAAAIGAGSLLGGLGSVLLAGRPRLGPAVRWGAVGAGLPVMLLGLGPGLLVAGALLVGFGMGRSVVTVAGQTLLQRTVREDVAARVFGVQEGLIQLATALGSAAGPLLVVAFGTRGALAAAGALLPVVALLVPGALARLDGRAVVPGPVFDRLNAIPFLAVLPLRVLERLARAGEQLDVPAGSAVIRQGEPGEHYFVVEAGRATVAVDGRQVRTIGPGEGFGEIALLTDSPRTATVSAVADLALVRLGRDDFLSAVGSTAPSLEGARWQAAELREADTRRGAGGRGGRRRAQ